MNWQNIVDNKDDERAKAVIAFAKTLSERANLELNTLGLMQIRFGKDKIGLPIGDIEGFHRADEGYLRFPHSKPLYICLKSSGITDIVNMQEVYLSPAKRLVAQYNFLSSFYIHAIPFEGNLYVNVSPILENPSAAQKTNDKMQQKENLVGGCLTVAAMTCAVVTNTPFQALGYAAAALVTATATAISSPEIIRLIRDAHPQYAVKRDPDEFLDFSEQVRAQIKLVPNLQRNI
jgi:hypothetical protein